MDCGVVGPGAAAVTGSRRSGTSAKAHAVRAAMLMGNLSKEGEAEGPDRRCQAGGNNWPAMAVVMYLTL